MKFLISYFNFKAQTHNSKTTDEYGLRDLRRDERNDHVVIYKITEVDECE